MKSQIPSLTRIDRSRDTERLYQLEEKQTEAIKASAKELGRILDYSPDQFWTHSLPAELFTLLDTYGMDQGLAAVVGYLRYMLQRNPDKVREYVTQEDAFHLQNTVTNHP